jgi:topoisomerase-4 subunit A
MNLDVSLSQFAQEAYKDYALYVLHDRALPGLIDGLKPVQRRLIYTMSLLHLDYQSKPKKSVRTVGDVLGKFHPHSDQACYEALVHLSQPFTTRYPLLHGQGNFGSQDDPKSFAAMRYTEVKLSFYASLLLNQLNEDIVPWQTNFDGTLSEPQVLPAQLPFLLLNGCSGIAVGMSCEIPSFNLVEVIDALLLLIALPKASVDDLIDVLPAPDFPAGGVIKATELELKNLFSTNTSSFIIEGRYVLEGKTLIIEQLPYGLSTSRLIEQIQQLIQKKDLIALSDLQDLSDHSQPVSLKCVFKTENDALKGLKVLLLKTDLRKTYRVYFNILNEHGIPSGMSIHEFLLTWIELRKSMMLKQYQRQMRLIDLRLHVINALGCVYQDIEKVIQIIRFEDDPWNIIAKKYELDQDQIEALKKLRLSQLTKLNAQELAIEKERLDQEKVVIYGLIHSPTKLKNALKKELTTLKKVYGDKRRTKILPASQEQVVALTHFKEKAAPVKNISLKIMITQMGWIKAFKAESEEEIDTAKSLRAGDSVVSILSCLSTEQLALWDNCGRVYLLKAHLIATSRFGEHVGSFISLPSGHEVIFMTLLQPVLVVTKNFLSMRVPVQDLGLSSRGIKVINLGQDDTLSHIHPIDSSYILVQSKDAMGVVVLDEISLQKKGKGVLLIDRKSNDIEKIDNFKDTFTVLLKKSRGKALERSFEDLLVKRGGKLKKIPSTHLSALRQIKTN